MMNCRICKGLISTDDLSKVKKLLPHSLHFIDVCNKCATAKDVEEMEGLYKERANKFGGYYLAQLKEFKEEIKPKLLEKYPNMRE